MARIQLLGSLAALGLAVGCGGAATDDTLSTGGDALTATQSAGEQLFDHETFDGNGRTCVTCHSAATGTINQYDIAYKFVKNHNDPIFRGLDADVEGGHTYLRLMTTATIRVKVALPPWLKLKNDPNAKSVTVYRGIPNTLDTPAIDTIFMSDGRQPTLVAQAGGAVHDHYQAGRTPTATELKQIAAYEKTLFSSAKVRNYAKTGVAPAYPAGTTASEKRGAAWFAPDGACGGCHTNNINESNTDDVRFASVGVSEANKNNFPAQTFIWTAPDGTTQEITTSDPGRLLIVNLPDALNTFKIPVLWNVKNTAPYFHDNSAQTLEQVMDQYQELFAQFGFPISDQDKKDLVAYMKLL